jgi:ribonuclease R
LKSLKRASYDTKPIGHYGLAKVNYTHFTSPIRRYADLVVHRVLAGAGRSAASRKCKANAPASVSRLSAADLPAVAQHISQTERVAASAEKESVKLKKLEFFINQLRLKRLEVYHAVVIDVRSYGLLIELPDALVTGMVSVSALTDDFYVFEPARMRFVGRRRKKTFQLGDRLKVSVSRVDAYKQQLDFFIAN